MGKSGKLPFKLRMVQSQLEGMPFGALEFNLPSGEKIVQRGREPGPTGIINVLDPSFFNVLLRDGQLGFSESYLDGIWDTPDLQGLLDVLLMNDEHFKNRFLGSRLFNAANNLLHILRSNTKRQARKNISYHYDLGNRFYRLWLDETMTYSSALFESESEQLEEAQHRKYASVYERIAPPEGGHLLEIGCGWGGFAEFAAKERGAKITGLTISPEQYKFASERMFRQGLNEKVSIELRDYRDERGTYDGVASIEMFEAVGEKYWPVYFGKVHDCLKPGAQATLQIITIADSLFPSYRKRVDFIQKYIFPGGMLPGPSALEDQIRKAGLVKLGSIEFGQSYSETLRRWYRRFNDCWDDVAAEGFDQRFRRLWNFYLTSCAAAFRYRATDVTQVTLQRGA
jgi:cyclopropane-fatty-acyl-phospholipid synthase